MVYIGAVLGLRVGEVIALQVEALDLLRGTLTVSRSAAMVHGQVIFGEPKSGAGRRTLSMPPALVSMLGNH